MEKIEEIQSKNKKIAEHRTILEKQLEEKQKKAEFDRIQKEKDKALIDQAIEEMKKKEQNYKNFYDKRTAILEQKNRLFQPIFDKDLINQELINKRTEEWEKATKEAQVLKEKQSWTQKLKAANEIKSEWNKQIEWKNKKKLEVVWIFSPKAPFSLVYDSSELHIVRVPQTPAWKPPFLVCSAGRESKRSVM